MKEIFERYRTEIQRNFDNWMEENEYEKVELSDEVLNDLMDEFFAFLSSQSNFDFVMDEIDKDRLLGLYDWCEEE